MAQQLLSGQGKAEGATLRPADSLSAKNNQLLTTLASENAQPLRLRS